MKLRSLFLKDNPGSWKKGKPATDCKDISGQRFARWLVVAHVGRKPGGSREHYWQCVCDCGATADVLGSSLRSGKSRSCGCLHRETASKNQSNLKHGYSRMPTYHVWHGMRERCNCSTCKDYPLYGGRGIKVCERWNDYTAFLADMGERPKGLTIERRDSNGDYEPANCYWATYSEQNNNRSINVFVEHMERRLTVSQWAHEFGVDPELVRSRLRRGWDIARAVQPPRRSA